MVGPKCVVMDNLAEFDKKYFVEEPGVSIIVQLIYDLENVHPVKCNVESAIFQHFV